MNIAPDPAPGGAALSSSLDSLRKGVAIVQLFAHKVCSDRLASTDEQALWRNAVIDIERKSQELDDLLSPVGKVLSTSDRICSLQACVSLVESILLPLDGVHSHRILGRHKLRTSIEQLEFEVQRLEERGDQPGSQAWRMLPKVLADLANAYVSLEEANKDADDCASIISELTSMRIADEQALNTYLSMETAEERQARLKCESEKEVLRQLEEGMRRQRDLEIEQQKQKEREREREFEREQVKFREHKRQAERERQRRMEEERVREEEREIERNRIQEEMRKSPEFRAWEQAEKRAREEAKARADRWEEQWKESWARACRTAAAEREKERGAQKAEQTERKKEEEEEDEEEEEEEEEARAAARDEPHWDQATREKKNTESAYKDRYPEELWAYVDTIRTWFLKPGLDYARISCFPDPPTKISCTKASCVSASTTRALRACSCQITQIFAVFSASELRRLRVAFHPDRFARCAEDKRAEFQKKAGEMFVALQT